MSDTETPSQPERGAWAVALVLKKQQPYGYSLSQSLSWRVNCTKEEAIGAAVTFAQEQKPDFAIELVTSARIDVPSSS